MTVSGDPGTSAQRYTEEEIYGICAPAAYLAALSVLHSPSDAEDVSQDACLVVFDAIHKGQSIPDVKNYAYSTGYHQALKIKGRRSRNVELDEQLAIPDQANQALRATSIAWAACKKLTVAQRTAVVLHDVEGLTGEEIGSAIGVKPKAAHELIRSGRDKMLWNVVEAVSHRRGEPLECRGRGRSIYLAMVGKLQGDQLTELRAHLDTCSYCRTSWDEIVQASTVAGLLLLFPPVAVLAKKTDFLRLVANRKPQPFPRASIYVAGLATLLLLIIGGVGIPAWISFHPTKPPVVGSPTPVAAPSVSAVPTPAPTPISTPPPPPQFAYLSKGEVWLSSLDGPATQLTTTGGNVDFYVWAPDGQSLVYKQTPGGTTIGQLHQIDLKGNQTWSLPTPVAGFSFSPDGKQWAALVDLDGSGKSVRTIFGSAGAAEDPSRSVDVYASWTGQATCGGCFTELRPLIWSVMPRGPGIWWTGSCIHVETGMLNSGFDLDPSTKAVSPDQWQNLFNADRAYRGPAGAPIQMGIAVVLVNGQPVSLPGMAVFLSVSADGRSGLVTWVRGDGGHEVSMVSADGQVRQFSQDGTTALAVWQPGPPG